MMQQRNRTLRRAGGLLAAALALPLLAPAAQAQEEQTEDFRFEAFGGVTPLGQSIYLPLEFAGGFVWTNCDVNDFSAVGIASLYYTGWGVETVMTTSGIPGTPKQVPFTALATDSGEHEDSWEIPSFESPDGAPLKVTAIKGHVKADGTPTCDGTSQFADATLQDVVSIAEGHSHSFVKAEGNTVVDSHTGSLSGIDIGNGALRIDRMDIGSVATVADGVPKLDQHVTYHGVTVNGQAAAITDEGIVLANQSAASDDDLRNAAEPIQEIKLSEGFTIKVRTLPEVQRVEAENHIAAGVIQGVEVVLNYPPAEGVPLANTSRGIAFRLGFASSHVQQFTVDRGQATDSDLGETDMPDGSADGGGAPGLPATMPAVPAPAAADQHSPAVKPGMAAPAPTAAAAPAREAQRARDVATRLIASEFEGEAPVADRMKTTYLAMMLSAGVLFAARLLIPRTQRARGER